MCEIAEAPVVALIFENGLAEVCGSPGGILEAITSHARKGEFHLSRFQRGGQRMLSMIPSPGLVRDADHGR
jgi:hypothetical protein